MEFALLCIARNAIEGYPKERTFTYHSNTLHIVYRQVMFCAEWISHGGKTETAIKKPWQSLDMTQAQRRPTTRTDAWPANRPSKKHILYMATNLTKNNPHMAIKPSRQGPAAISQEDTTHTYSNHRHIQPHQQSRQRQEETYMT